MVATIHDYICDDCPHAGWCVEVGECDRWVRRVVPRPTVQQIARQEDRKALRRALVGPGGWRAALRLALARYLA